MSEGACYHVSYVLVERTGDYFHCDSTFKLEPGEKFDHMMKETIRGTIENDVVSSLGMEPGTVDAIIISFQKFED